VARGPANCGAEEQQVAKGVLIPAVQAPFVAENEVEGAGSGKATERGGEATGEIAFGAFGHAPIHEAGLAALRAAKAPVCHHHLLDGSEFDVIDGAERVKALGQKGFEVLTGLVVEDDATGTQAVTQGVLRRMAFPFRSYRAAGTGAVGARGEDSFER
jgi:hypothetical protein